MLKYFQERISHDGSLHLSKAWLFTSCAEDRCILLRRNGQAVFFRGEHHFKPAPIIIAVLWTAPEHLHMR